MNHNITSKEIESIILDMENKLSDFDYDVISKRLNAIEDVSLLKDVFTAFFTKKITYKAFIDLPLISKAVVRNLLDNVKVDDKNVFHNHLFKPLKVAISKNTLNDKESTKVYNNDVDTFSYENVVIRPLVSKLDELAFLTDDEFFDSYNETIKPFIINKIDNSNIDTLTSDFVSKYLPNVPIDIKYRYNGSYHIFDRLINFIKTQMFLTSHNKNAFGDLDFLNIIMNASYKDHNSYEIWETYTEYFFSSTMSGDTDQETLNRMMGNLNKVYNLDTSADSKISDSEATLVQLLYNDISNPNFLKGMLFLLNFFEYGESLDKENIIKDSDNRKMFVEELYEILDEIRYTLFDIIFYIYGDTSFSSVKKSDKIIVPKVVKFDKILLNNIKSVGE